MDGSVKGRSAGRHGDRRREVSVFAPVLGLDVAVDREAVDGRTVHFHPSGQGFWVARMVARLGMRVTLCAPLGGEPGRVLRGLVEAEGVRLLSVELEHWSGVWLSDGPSGDDATILETEVPRLARHEIDDLYGITLATGLESGVAVLTGSPIPTIDSKVYARLSRDLRENGAFVICDVSGDDLRSALSGGVDVVKIADDELVDGGWADGNAEHDLLEGIERLRADGASSVLVSRADSPPLLSTGDAAIRIEMPRFQPHNHRGAGDSMTAALAAAVARGESLPEAARLAAAAGALNVTRSGLGTGDRRAIDRLVGHVTLERDGAAGDLERRSPDQTEMP